jgi:hypothetical protein
MEAVYAGYGALNSARTNKMNNGLTRVRDTL